VATSKPSVFNVDRDWLIQLAQGRGRDEPLNGKQRHFISVIKGSARPIEAAEKAALREYERLKAEFDGNAINFPQIEAYQTERTADCHIPRAHAL
jgi:hypothetical protein